MAGASTTTRLDERVKAMVADWPPLNDEQRARIAALLSPAGTATTPKQNRSSGGLSLESVA